MAVKRRRAGHRRPVLRLALAQRLRHAGLTWSPERGDRFVVPERDMDGEVFVISDFTVEVHQLPLSQVIGFNGTTEWALDSLRLDQVLWLPREEQLRRVLGQRFHRLEAVADGWAVVVAAGGQEQRFVAADPEDAYALAVVDVLAR